jgi:hypothetical protein
MMKARRIWQSFLCVLVVLIASCSQESEHKNKIREATRRSIAEDHSLNVEAYLQLGMPSPDRMWTSEDYSQAARVLKSIAEKDVHELPRYNSRTSGKLFERISSRENLATILDKNLSLDTRLPLAIGYVDGLKQTLMIYLEPSARGTILDAEMGELMGLMLRWSREVMDLANEFMASLPKDDSNLAVRQEGFARMKNGLVTTFNGAIISLGETNIYRTSVRIRLCGYLEETLPPVIQEFPASVRTEIPLRVKRMQVSESDEQMKKSLADLHQAIAVALAR